MQSLTEEEIPDETPPKSLEGQGSKPKKVSRSIVNLMLDAVLLMAAVLLFWVSLVMRMVFPPPTVADQWELWGLSYDRWEEIQFSTLCVVALLALEHLVLHWNWVCGIIATKIFRVKQRPDEANQAVYGVAAFITLLLTMLAGLIAATLSIQKPPT